MLANHSKHSKLNSLQVMPLKIPPLLLSQDSGNQNHLKKLSAACQVWTVGLETLLLSKVENHLKTN